MSHHTRTAWYAFIATNFLAAATLLIGYSVANYNTAQYEASYEFSNTPATGEHTAH